MLTSLSISVFEKAVEHGVRHAFSSVVEARASKRSREFFDEFTKAVSQGMTEDDRVNNNTLTLLANISEDEEISELLFCAYRHVALSKSMILGPRIIAVLTAQIILECRMPTDIEKAVFAAAESISDEDMVEMSKWIYEQTHDTDIRVVEISSDEYKLTHLGGSSEQEVGPVDLSDHLAPWATEAEKAAVIHQEITQKISERNHVLEESDKGTFAEIKHHLRIYPSAILLASTTRAVSANTKYYF